MLIVLVGVTTLLLLIMGVVSTFLLGRRVDNQVAAVDKRLTYLSRALQADPQDAPALKVTDFAVIEVPVTGQLTVRPLTHGALTSQLTAATQQQLKSPALAPAETLAGHGELARARLCLRASVRPVPVPGLQAVHHRARAAGGQPLGTGGPDRHRAGAVLLVAEPEIRAVRSAAPSSPS